jgi:hypothetical protein
MINTDTKKPKNEGCGKKGGFWGSGRETKI